MPSLTARSSESLRGVARVPGDKSISHRALILGALAVGDTVVDGLLEGEDVLRTAAALRQLGAEVERDGKGRWHIWGRGIGGLGEPDDVLDMGNSGTAARLLMGVLASHPINAMLNGDASLRRRPMERVAGPLRAMGAEIAGREGCRLPLLVRGSGDVMPIRYRLPVPSAQVKSAVLLAGLNAPGKTTVIEPLPTRDHTERMLRHFGADLRIEEETGENGESTGGRVISLRGQPELSARPVRVPSDPSSAAFPLIAALILPGSRIRLEGVGLNPHRVGLLATLEEMGACIRIVRRREEAGEPVGDLEVTASVLHGVEVPAGRAPSMIDEYPVLAMAAAVAEGPTVMRGLAELRVKESDRLGSVARGLAACGVDVEEGEDSLTVRGTGSRPRGGARIESALDHRIAMSFLVLGLASERPVTIDDARPIETSFPGFAELMRGLGADISGAEGAGPGAPAAAGA